MTDITQVITALPAAPNPATQTPSEFSTTAAASVLAQRGLPTEINAWSTQANVLAGEVNVNATTAATKASEASASADASASSAVVAAGAANYVGAWSSLAGAQSAGISATHLGAFWVLLSNVADVTLEEPGTSAEWARAYGAGQIDERTSNTELSAEDNGKIINVTSGTFSQTLDAAATLGENWSITYYNSGTGVITLDPDGSELIDGASTKTVPQGHIVFISCTGTAFKTIVQAAPAGDHSVVVTTGNGHGSTNTKVRRFTTTLSSTGTSITYADSGTLGATFTINSAGLYEIHTSDLISGSNTLFGASVNSSELTTAIQAITAANRLAVSQTPGSSLMSAVTVTARLSAGDVVRPHTDGTPNSTDAYSCVFSIRKVGV
jgi:hypothetical protein